MSMWINQFQHIPDKDVIFVGLLNEKTDDFNKASWVMQIEDAKTAVELPGILDEVISMVPSNTMLVHAYGVNSLRERDSTSNIEQQAQRSNESSVTLALLNK